MYSVCREVMVVLLCFYQMKKRSISNTRYNRPFVFALLCSSHVEVNENKGLDKAFLLWYT